MDELKSQKQQDLDGALIVGDDVDAREEAGGAPTGIAGDGKAEQAAEALSGILYRMGLVARVTIREDAERVVLDVQGDDAGRVIGKKGQTLDSLQFLVNKIVNRFPEGRRHIIVDSGDYRARHDNGLISLAKFPGVSTRSDGQGADRRIQIIPSRASRGGLDRAGRR